MWIRREEYQQLKNESDKYKKVKRELDTIYGEIDYGSFVVLPSGGVLFAKATWEQFTDHQKQDMLLLYELKEERDTWITQYKQKDADAEFWKSLYIDYRKLYEESCIAKK